METLFLCENTKCSIFLKVGSRGTKLYENFHNLQVATVVLNCLQFKAFMEMQLLINNSAIQVNSEYIEMAAVGG